MQINLPRLHSRKGGKKALTLLTATLDCLLSSVFLLEKVFRETENKGIST
jgi:hypothetical protein